MAAHMLENQATGVVSIFDAQFSALTGQHFEVPQRTDYIFCLIAVM